MSDLSILPAGTIAYIVYRTSRYGTMEIVRVYVDESKARLHCSADPSLGLLIRPITK